MILRSNANPCIIMLELGGGNFMKQIKRRRVLLWALAVIIALVSLAASRLYGSGSKTEEVPDIPKKEAGAPQQEPVPSDLKGFTEYIVKKELGAQTSNYKDRIRIIEIKQVDNKGDVTIELNGNDGFTKEITVRGMMMDSKKLFKQLSQRDDINKVTVTEYLEVDDMDGSIIDEWAFTMVMEKSKIDKIAKENLPLDDLLTLAEEYKLHPNLR